MESAKGTRKRAHILPHATARPLVHTAALALMLASALATALITGCARPAPTEDPQTPGAPITDQPLTEPAPLTDVEPPVRSLSNPVIAPGTPLADVVDPGLAELIAAPDTPGVRLVYTRYGEASESIEVDDPEQVSAILLALGNIRLADPAVLMATDAGEGFVFTTADGTELTVYFELGQLQVEGDFYEVEGAEDLWRTVSTLH